MMPIHQAKPIRSMGSKDRSETSLSSQSYSQRHVVAGDADEPTPSAAARSRAVDDVVMTNRETAAYLRTTVEQMVRLRRSGKGPPFGQVGKLIRYRKSAVDAWLTSRTMTPAD